MALTLRPTAGCTAAEPTDLAPTSSTICCFDVEPYERCSPQLDDDLALGAAVFERRDRICRALERSMVAYQAKLDALLDATVQERQAHTGVTHTNGNGPELA